MSKLSRLIELGVVAVSIGALGWVAFDVFRIREQFGLASTSKIDDRPILLQKIQDASELTTAIQTLQVVIPASETNTIAGYETGTTTLLYIAVAEVRAGIDLAQLTDDRVTASDDEIVIKLPAPSILNISHKPEQSQVYDSRKDGFFPPDNEAELLHTAQIASLDRFQAAACANGILKQAELQAVRVIQNQLRFTPKPVSIMVDPPTDCGGTDE